MFYSMQLLHCLMVLVVLTVHCIFKPYKKESINFIEVVILFCLLGATLAILDENDIYIERGTSIFFITIPFVYALVVFIYYIFAKLYRLAKNISVITFFFKLTLSLSLIVFVL